jgi:hypothetical protein
MARKTLSRKVRARNIAPLDTPAPNARQLWLAGLGLAAMTGRSAVGAARTTAERIADARRQAIAGVEQARSSVEQTVEQARTTLIEATSDLRDRVETEVARAGFRLESALAPLVEKFKPGKAKRAVRRGRKPAARKPAGRKATARRAPARKPVNKVARRARKG